MNTNTKRLHRVRSCFTIVFGAIAILGVIAFAPKADASDCNFKYRPSYRFDFESNRRAIERSEARKAEKLEALNWTHTRFSFRNRNRPLLFRSDFEQDKPKKTRTGLFSRFRIKF